MCVLCVRTPVRSLGAITRLYRVQWPFPRLRFQVAALLSWRAAVTRIPTPRHLHQRVDHSFTITHMCDLPPIHGVENFVFCFFVCACVFASADHPSAAATGERCRCQPLIPPDRCRNMANRERIDSISKFDDYWGAAMPSQQRNVPPAARHNVCISCFSRSFG